MRFSFPRESYIPKGSMRIADKKSDAVAYAYTNARGKAAAAMFYGKQAKPIWHYSFRTEAARTARVTEAFTARQDKLASVAAMREADKAAPRGLVIGDILKSSWGYEQTNVDFYEVTALHGKNGVTIRKIGCESVEDGHMTGYCVPQSGTFVGEPVRKVARNGSVRLTSYSTACKWNTETVAGVPIGPRARWSAYA